MVAVDTFLMVVITLIPFITTMPSVKQVPEIRMGKSSYGRGYSFEKHENYPQNIIEKLVQTMNMTVDGNYTLLPPRGFVVDENDCDRNILMNEIYEIVDRNDNVRVVVQSEGVKQLFEVEECITPGQISKPSIHFNKYIVSNFNLQCQQTLLDFSFQVLNMDWTGIELVKSKHGIPVACNCVIVDK